MRSPSRGVGHRPTRSLPLGAPSRFSHGFEPPRSSRFSHGLPPPKAHRNAAVDPSRTASDPESVRLAVPIHGARSPPARHALPGFEPPRSSRFSHGLRSPTAHRSAAVDPSLTASGRSCTACGHHRDGGRRSPARRTVALLPRLAAAGGRTGTLRSIRAVGLPIGVVRLAVAIARRTAVATRRSVALLPRLDRSSVRAMPHPSARASGPSCTACGHRRCEALRRASPRASCRRPRGCHRSCPTAPADRRRASVLGLSVGSRSRRNPSSCERRANGRATSPLSRGLC